LERLISISPFTIGAIGIGIYCPRPYAPREDTHMGIAAHAAGFPESLSM